MGCEFTMRKSNGLRVHRKKERWGRSSPREGVMGGEFTIRKSGGVRVHN